MTCQSCKIDYPDELVQPMYSSAETQHLCGICSLELSNNILGLKRKKFSGSIAEILRRKAIKYRKEHGLNDART